MKQKLSLNIAGNNLTVITDEEEEYVRSLAAKIDKRVSDMVFVKNHCTKAEAITLCLLDYLDETEKLRAENEKLKEEINELKKK